MIRALIKYLLILCIILLSGSIQLFAHKAMESALCSTSLAMTDHARVDIEHEHAFNIQSASPNTEKKESKVFVPNIVLEEDESDSFEKNLGSSNFFTAFFYALVFGYITFNINKGIHPYKHFSNFSSLQSLHIIFCVYRI